MPRTCSSLTRDDALTARKLGPLSPRTEGSSSNSFATRSRRRLAAERFPPGAFGVQRQPRGAAGLGSVQPRRTRRPVRFHGRGVENGERPFSASGFRTLTLTLSSFVMPVAAPIAATGRARPLRAVLRLYFAMTHVARASTSFTWVISFTAASSCRSTGSAGL